MSAELCPRNRKELHLFTATVDEDNERPLVIEEPGEP